MRLGSMTTNEGRACVVRVDDGLAVPLNASEITDRSIRAARPAADPIPLGDVQWLPPICAPSKIVCIGLNYRDHATESGLDLPDSPLLFLKPSSALVGHRQAIRFPREASQQVDFEAELAVVIGRRARNVPVSRALDYVFGYTAANDVSARDVQFADGQWTRGKGFDTFCPLGPVLVTADEVEDPQVLGIRAVVNGVTLQDSSTAEMVFGVAELVAYVSAYMTLEPDDLILTGTPAGVGFVRTPPVFLNDGDVVEIDIDVIGVLSNAVVVE